MDKTIHFTGVVVYRVGLDERIKIKNTTTPEELKQAVYDLAATRLKNGTRPVIIDSTTNPELIDI